MRDILDGTRIQDSKVVQGIFWATPFQNIAGNFALPDDPSPSYVFNNTSGSVKNIALPRLIGNTVYGGPTGLTAAQVTSGAMNGLYLEIINGSTGAGNTLQATNAPGDAGGANVGATLAAQVSTTKYVMGQYQVINGAWIEIL